MNYEKLNTCHHINNTYKFYISYASYMYKLKNNLQHCFQCLYQYHIERTYQAQTFLKKQKRNSKKLLMSRQAQVAIYNAMMKSNGAYKITIM